MSASGRCWARDPYDGRLHACDLVEVLVAAAREYAPCLCGHRLPADVSLEDGPSGRLCIPCVIRVSAEMDDPDRTGTAS